jgi:hypothetical protein
MRHTELSALLFVLLLESTVADAAPITFRRNVSLQASQIYDCGGGAYPFGTMCWTNDREESTTEVRRKVVGPADTAVIRMRFLRGERLRWEHDGIIAPVAGDESVQVGLWKHGEPFGYHGTWSSFLSFEGVTGDLQANNLRWSVTGTSGGLVSHSYLSGVTNLTNTYFEFAGITAEIGPFGAGTGLPHDVDRLAVFFTSGHFSIVPKSVPEPGTLSLLGAMIGTVLVGRQRKRVHRACIAGAMLLADLASYRFQSK